MKYYIDELSKLRLTEEGQEPQDGWVEATKEEAQAIINSPKSGLGLVEELKNHFKSLYLGIFDAKLKELDYDSIATVSMWANKNGSAFQEEAKLILDWYEAIITYNYGLINAGPIPTDEEYLAGMPVL